MTTVENRSFDPQQLIDQYPDVELALSMAAELPGTSAPHDMQRRAENELRQMALEERFSPVAMAVIDSAIADEAKPRHPSSPTFMVDIDLVALEEAEHQNEVRDPFSEEEDARILAAAHIERAKQMAASSKRSTPEQDTQTVYELDFGQIGWLGEDDLQPIQVEHIENDEGDYYYGSIVDRDRPAKKALDKLERQDAAGKLLTGLKEEYLPKFWHDIVSGGRVRPVSIGKSGKSNGGLKAINTSYPAYKLDVQGTNNRAIVLVAGKIEGKPVMVLAAVYDHEDQSAIYRHMSPKGMRINF